MGFSSFTSDLGGGGGNRCELTGGKSLCRIRDYLETLSERWRTSPAATKHALVVWAEALCIDWPVDNPSVASDAAIDSDGRPRLAPAMNIQTVRQIEALARDKLANPYKRSFAAGVLLIPFASIRFVGAQRLVFFEVNDDSVYGSLSDSQTEKHHVQFRPWACHRMGIARADWALPLLEMRRAFERTNGTDLSCTYLRRAHIWEIESTEAAPYSATRRKCPPVRRDGR